MPENDLDAEIDLSEIPEPAELPYVETDCAEDAATAELQRTQVDDDGHDIEDDE